MLRLPGNVSRSQQDRLVRFPTTNASPPGVGETPASLDNIGNPPGCFGYRVRDGPVRGRALFWGLTKHLAAWIINALPGMLRLPRNVSRPQ